MRLLDLYCGAGGCAMGYYRAGFTEIVGVDLFPQKRYPFTFVRGDAIAYLLKHGKDFDFIHASPPCQEYCALRHLHPDRSYPDLVGPTRDALQRVGRPYVIENVPGAPLIDPIMLCGAMFDLKVYRHRLFETSFFMLNIPHIPHRDNTPSAGRGVSKKGFISVTGNGGSSKVLGFSFLAYAKKAMGIDWMSRAELSQAIPPAYTEYIGSTYLERVRG